DLDEEEQRLHLHPGEVTRAGGTLLTAGSVGYVMVATGAGHDVPAARGAAYRTAAKVVVPNLRYRLDIGQRFIDGDRSTLERLGWFSPPPRDD
ncbi:MAG: hypothetical protein ACXWLL_04860, partial [Myxococcaceae bacterium]